MTAESIRSTSARRPGSDKARIGRIGLAVILLIAVWAFARYGGRPPSDPGAAGVFPHPVTFIVSPPGQIQTINVRTGPGIQFDIGSHLNRGDRLAGVERVTDLRGAPWIRLSDARGFVKESILATEESGPP